MTMEILWNTMPRMEWQAATQRAAWQQGWAYGEAWRAIYGPVRRAEIIDSGTRIGVAQFTVRRFLRHLNIANCARGPVWLGDVDPQTRAEAYRLLRRSIPLPRLRGSLITPDQGPEEGRLLSAHRFKRIMTPYSTAMLDLTQDEDALRRAMQGKWRNRLKRAEAAGLRIKPAPAAAGQYDWLLTADAAQQKARRYLGSPASLTTRWQTESTDDDGATILSAHRGAERIAAMMVLTHGKGALYQVGWTNAAGRAANAHNLLMWRMILTLKGKGIETLDLGGVDTTVNTGIARFKLGSGGQVRTLCGTWL